MMKKKVVSQEKGKRAEITKIERLYCTHRVDCITKELESSSFSTQNTSCHRTRIQSNSKAKCRCIRSQPDFKFSCQNAHAKDCLSSESNLQELLNVRNIKTAWNTRPQEILDYSPYADDGRVVVSVDRSLPHSSHQLFQP